MKITVTGTDYLGLLTGGCVADLGNDVHCQDIFFPKFSILNDDTTIHDEYWSKYGTQLIVDSEKLRVTKDVADNSSYDIEKLIGVFSSFNQAVSAILKYALFAAYKIVLRMTGYKIGFAKLAVMGFEYYGIGRGLPQ